MPSRKNGFTLIELLTVLAIICLFATLTLITIARYRDRARDSRVEAVLSQIRAVAAMIQPENNSYGSLCDPTDNTLNGGLDDENRRNLKIIEDDAERIVGSKPSCFASQTSFCVQSSLVTPGNYYCVDSEGISKRTFASICSDSNLSCTPPASP